MFHYQYYNIKSLKSQQKYPQRESNSHTTNRNRELYPFELCGFDLASLARLELAAVSLGKNSSIHLRYRD